MITAWSNELNRTIQKEAPDNAIICRATRPS
jgi:hypothetical protein